MSDTYDRIVEQLDDNEQVISSKTFRCEFSGGVLTVGLLTIDSDGNETIQPGLSQPWKCMPDGSRENFVDAADAFAWVDSVAGTLIN